MNRQAFSYVHGLTGPCALFSVPLTFNERWSHILDERHKHRVGSSAWKNAPQYNRVIGDAFDHLVVAPAVAAVETLFPQLEARSRRRSKQGQDIIAQVSGEASTPGPPKQQLKAEVKKEVKREMKVRNYNKERKGDTMTAMPTSFGSTISLVAPTLRSSKDGVVVSGREMIASVNVPSTVPNTNGFANCNYVYINPGISQSFPKLSNIAKDYEYYRFKSLRFDYVPRVATNTNGDVYLVPDYDPNDNIVLDEISALSFSESKMSSNFLAAFTNLNPSLMLGTLTRKTIRYNYGTLPTDLQEYDSGSFSVYSNGQTAGTGLGRLLVSYVVELIAARKLDPMSDAYSLSLNATLNNVSATNPLGDGTLQAAAGGYQVSFAAGGLMTNYRPGGYLIALRWGGTSMGSMTVAATASDTSGAITVAQPAISTTTAFEIIYYFTTHILPSSTITFVVSGAPTLTSCSILITPFSSVSFEA